MESMPWSFKRHLIIFHRLGQGEDPLQVPLVYTDFWVQVHNLPIGVVLEGLAPTLVTREIMRYMHINVKIYV
ncbi:hypothetical protein ES288_D05G211800v1 [Gossypium darwinii]|uniref:Uncharacterized protein n=1 Tax=Gossypium darwinii TaxID=34276 RepID=A0A5D2CLP5_GOSDA|nr:hypothetical protein ES288_D05G211800v1 [Gossypium darwinii]